MWPKNFGELVQGASALGWLVLAIAAVGALFYFGKPLKAMLPKLRNVKFGKVEAELSPGGGAEVGTIPVAGSPAEKQKEPDALPAPKEPAETEPGEAWRMIDAFSRQKFDEAQSAFERIQKAEGEALARLTNQAMYHFLMYRHGRDAQAIQKLEELAQNSEARGMALYWLGSCYEFSRDFTKAIGVHARALSGPLTPKDRTMHAVALAKCHVSAGNADDGLMVLTTSLRDAAEPESKRSLYQAIAEIHEKTGDSTARAISLQKVLDFSPGDPRALFAAAYAQSEAKMSCLCISNYRTLLGFQPDHEYGLNNLGVQCDALELPIKAIAHFKRATEQGNTLAMANLAFRYMNQGFASEAQDQLDRARKLDEPHENVGSAMSTLAENRQKEERAWSEIATAGIRQQEFFGDYAEAYFIPAAEKSEFAGQWISPNGGVFAVTQVGATVTAKWETETAGEKFTGTVRNRALQISFQTKATDIFGPARWGSVQSGFAFISPDGEFIRVHTFDKRTVFFLLLKKKSQPRLTTA